MMAAATEIPAVPDEARRLAVRVPMTAERSVVLSLLTFDAGTWLGEPVETVAKAVGPGGHRRRFATDLRLRVSDRSERALFRKAAIVELGTPVEAPDGTVSVEIGWRAAMQNASHRSASLASSPSKSTPRHHGSCSAMHNASACQASSLSGGSFHHSGLMPLA